MTTTGTGWSSNVPISMPRPLDGHGDAVKNNESLVPMNGFCITANGLFHDLTQKDLETYTTGVVTVRFTNAAPIRADGDV